LRHELLNVLQGMAGVTRQLQLSGLTSEQKMWLEAMQRSVDQADYLVRAAAPWEKGGVAESGPSRRFNGKVLLEQALLAHMNAAREKGLSLKLSVAPGLPIRWRGDACLVRQLLDNLLGNAVKFTTRGEVRLSARLERDATVVLTVADTGPGIPEPERELVFRARERGSGGRDQPGCGLGLWLSRRIATRLGGEICCHAAPGGGAEFSVSLPGLAGSGSCDQSW
jgi:signal transduction histidine kinase